MIRRIKIEDIDSCLKIYNFYIKNTTNTLELEELSYDIFKERVVSISANYPYLVYEESGIIVAYAYLYEFSPRGGYKYTCGITEYVDKDQRGRGIGKALVESLITEAKAMDLRDIIAVVTSENEASISFHKAMGFTEQGHFEGVAEKFGRRFGVNYLQCEIK